MEYTPVSRRQSTAQLLEVSSHTFVSDKFESVVAEAVEFFSKTQPYPLPPEPKFLGAGVYGIYYTGSFEPYTSIAAANQSELIQPIYIGKAVPPGWRTSRGTIQNTSSLHSRLKQHANSLVQGALDPTDFRCRFMILSGVESDLIGAAEAALIRRYRPLWNAGIDGFGNHDPGKGRYNQACSHWDILHPGRKWVAKLTGHSMSQEDVLQRVKDFLALPIEQQIELAEQSLVYNDHNSEQEN